MIALAPAHIRAEARKLRSDIRVLQSSRDLQPQNTKRARLHQKAIRIAEVQLEEIL